MNARESQATVDTELAAPLVEDLLRAVSSTLRSYRLYAGNGPALERFVQALRQKFIAIWEHLPMVRLTVDESSLSWEGERVYPTGDGKAEKPSNNGRRLRPAPATNSSQPETLYKELNSPHWDFPRNR